MTAASVTLVGTAQEWLLSESAQTVQAQPLSLLVSGTSTRSIRVDGRLHRLSSGGLLNLDLTRSTGFHRVDLDGQTFWFATQDRKLELAGVADMLRELSSMGTGWSGQAMFSDGSGFRDPHVVYGWLDNRADDILDAVDSVLLAPRQALITSEKLSRRGGGAIRTVPTLRLLRSAPRRYLEQRPNGALTIDDSSYDPTRVVVRHRTQTLQTVPNRRAVLLLSELIRLLGEVLASPAESAVRTRCRLWLSRAHQLQARPLARTLRAGPNVLRVARQGDELTDRRYLATYEFARDLSTAFGWNPSSDTATRYSYVQRADVIYQAYAASRLAAALGLTQTTSVLGAKPLAFESDEYELYFDAPCPPDVLRSWRADSTLPDQSRPDVVLVEKHSGRLLVLDAKYRVGTDGMATEDSRKEVTSYMGLYGLKTVGVLYPGAGPSLRSLEGHGQRIIELPVAPGVDTVDDAIPTLLGLLESGPYRQSQ